jgi:hypothetical protein
MKKAERESFNQDLKAAAFTAWRFEVSLGSLLGGQVKITFMDYCEKMGLLTDQEKKQNIALKRIQRLHNKQLVKDAEQRANDIMAIDKANRLKEQQAKGG